MSTIHTYQYAELSSAQVRAVVTLLDSIWPSEGRTLDALTDTFFEAEQKRQQEHRSDQGAAPLRFVIWENKQAIAHATTFTRTIFAAEGPLGVMALAGVCVASTHRGKGLGAAISRKAFERVDQGIYPVSLFQTPVPGFYEKLGARRVNNTFVNSRNKQNPTASPWQDVFVMIYPKHYPWPEGVIDLNGSGY